jgi:predicted ATPase
LARHCAEAGLAEKAVAYRLKAGQQATARSQMTEAVAQLRKGLDVLAGLPDGFWRRQQELDLQIALRPALAATKGHAAADVGEALARARALAEQINRPEYLMPLLYGQWAFHVVRSEHKLALSLAEQMERIGEVRNDVAAQLLGRRTRGVICLYLGDFVAARTLLEQCHGLSDQAHRTIGAGLSFDAYAVMLGDLALTLAYLGYIDLLGDLAVTLAYLGYIDQARSRLNEALSEARQLRHAHTLALVLHRANRTESITCSPELQRHAEEFLALSTEYGFSLWVGWALAYRGRSLTAIGQAQEGHARLTQGLAAVRATGNVSGTPIMLTWLAEACAKLGQPSEGLNCLAEAAQIIETTEERAAEAELHRVRGDLLNATGDRSAAERNYRLALAVAERQSAKVWQLRASISLARLWRDQGKIADAQVLLTPVYNWFTEGFDAPDLIEAKALLGELGG